MKNNTPKVMLLWHANPNPFAPPVFFDNQITGVLDEHAGQIFNYGQQKFSIPRGEFDLEELLDRQSIEKPDYLFVCLDSTTPYFPRNIDRVCKNSFLCLGDSHHLPNPISRLTKYVTLEKFQGHIFTNNIRHAHWFNHFSTAEQYFEPGLFALNLGEFYKEGAKTTIDSTPVFYGQIGDFHPRRKRIVPTLIKQNLVKHIWGDHELLCTEMQKSLACINVTLNADLNSRVFEIAQTGCLQIVDELSIHNGHGLVLIPNHNCLTYKTEDELTAILKDKGYIYEYGKTLGKNLKHEYKSHWGIECIRKRLLMSVNSGTIKFNSAVNTRKIIDTSLDVKSRLKIYENLLEMHRCLESINLSVDGSDVEIFINDAADLPRLNHIEKSLLIEPSISNKFLIRKFDDSEPELFSISNN